MAFSRQGIGALPNKAQIGGVTIFVGGTITSASDIPNAIGDIYIETTAGKLYIAGAATATTDWNLVTSA